MSVRHSFVRARSARRIWLSMQFVCDIVVAPVVMCRAVVVVSLSVAFERRRILINQQSMCSMAGGTHTLTGSELCDEIWFVRLWVPRWNVGFMARILIYLDCIGCIYTICYCFSHLIVPFLDSSIHQLSMNFIALHSYLWLKTLKDLSLFSLLYTYMFSSFIALIA